MTQEELNEELKRIGCEFKKQREDLNLTKIKICQRSNMNPNTLGSIESGLKNYSLGTFRSALKSINFDLYFADKNSPNKIENIINMTDLVKFRKERNLTQKELADILEVSTETIVKSEGGKGNPRINLIIKWLWEFDKIVKIFDTRKVHIFSQDECSCLVNRTIEKLGKEIRHHRENKGITREELCVKSNISFRTLSEYEIGNRNISINALKKIMHILGLSLRIVDLDDSNKLGNIFSPKELRQLRLDKGLTQLEVSYLLNKSVRVIQKMEIDETNFSISLILQWLRIFNKTVKFEEVYIGDYLDAIKEKEMEFQLSLKSHNIKLQSNPKIKELENKVEDLKLSLIISYSDGINYHEEPFSTAKLSSLRKNLNLTMGEVCIKSGLTLHTVSHLETNSEDISVNTLLKYLTALNAKLQVGAKQYKKEYILTHIKSLEDLRFKLKYYRKKKDLSKRKLAKLCNVSTEIIHQIERGDYDPDLGLIYLIAEKLDIKLYASSKDIISTKDKLGMISDEEVSDILIRSKESMTTIKENLVQPKISTVFEWKEIFDLVLYIIELQ